MGFWAALEKHSPTRASNAAGVIKQPTCSTAFPQSTQAKAKTMLHDIWRAEAKEKPRKRSFCSSKPLRTNTQKRRPFCNKTNPNCAPSTTFLSLAGRVSERQIQSSPLCHDLPLDKAIKGHASHHVQTGPMRSGKLAAHKTRRHHQYHQIPRRRTPNPTRNNRRMIKGLTPELTITRPC